MPAENIFAQYAQPVRSVTDYLNDYDAQDLRKQQLIGAQRTNALAALTQQQTMRQMADADADRNALQSIASGWNAQTTAAQRAASLRSSGRAALMTQADAVERQDLERQKIESEDRDKKAAAVAKLVEIQGELAKRVLATPTREAAAAAVANMKATAQMLGLPIDSSADEAAISQFQSPDDVKRWAAGHSLKAEQLLPKLQTINTGGSQVQQAVDPLTGVARTTGTMQNTATPGDLLSAETQRRGQNMVDARARETNQLTREANATVYDPERGILVNKATGLARPAATMDGKPVPAKTPESTKKELASIDAQMSVLDGAIRDVEASPGAFSFKRGLATMTGGLAESAVGRLDSSAERDARSYVFNVVSKVINERAGAAQSAQELARLRSFLPAETDNAQQIKDKLESFKGYLADLGNGYQAGRYQPQMPKAAAQGPKKINSDAEYDALPSGATFVGPDGKTRRKP